MPPMKTTRYTLRDLLILIAMFFALGAGFWGLIGFDTGMAYTLDRVCTVGK